MLRGPRLFLYVLAGFSTAAAASSAHPSPTPAPLISTGIAPKNLRDLAPCPEALFDQIASGDHSSGGWLAAVKPMIYWMDTSVLKGADSCRNYLTNTFKNPFELEKLFSKIPELSLGPEHDMLASRCLIGSPAAARMQSEDRYAAVADYVALMTRLKTGTVGDIETIAAIDRTLGQPVLAGVPDFDNKEVPGSKDAVVQISGDPRCTESRTADFDGMVSQTLSAFASLQEIAQKSAINHHKALGVRDRGPGTVIDEAVQTKLDQAREAILNNFSWMKSKEFEPLMGQRYVQHGRGRSFDQWSKGSIEDTLKKHLQNARQGLVEQVTRFKDAGVCIHSPQLNCLNKSFKALSETPDINLSGILKNIHDRQQTRFTKEEAFAIGGLGTSECRQSIRELKKEANDTARSFVGNTALTVATFGAGAYANIALRGVEAGGFASKIPAMTKVIQSVGTKFPLSLRLAQGTVFGSDGLWLGEAGVSAYAKCFGKMETAITRDTRSLSRQISCGNVTVGKVSAEIANRNCLLEASMAAVNALPFLPKVVGKVMSGEAKVAKAIDSPELSSTVSAVEKEHVSIPETHSEKVSTEAPPVHETVADVTVDVAATTPTKKILGVDPVALAKVVGKPAGLTLGVANDLLVTCLRCSSIIPDSVAGFLPLSNDIANVAANATGKRWLYNGLSKSIADGIAMGTIVGHAITSTSAHGPVSGLLTFAGSMGITYWFPVKYFHPVMHGIPEVIPESMATAKKFAKSISGQTMIGASLIVVVEQTMHHAEELILKHTGEHPLPGTEAENKRIEDALTMYLVDGAANASSQLNAADQDRFDASLVYLIKGGAPPEGVSPKVKRRLTQLNLTTSLGSLLSADRIAELQTRVNTIP
ncbi:MAG: hypothetical protein ABIR96_12505 [Bdellovibrionota bacterium]